MAWNDAEEGFEKSTLPRRRKRRQRKSLDPFKPWYKPRKQWVRRHQWCACVNEHLLALKDSPRYGTDRTYRYLTLPGPEMIDVWLLREICEQQGFSLRYVGFNDIEAGDEEDKQMNNQEEQIKGLGSVDESSEIVRGKFESLGKTDSRAFERMDDHGPYDALNIDLCDGVADGRGRDDQVTSIDAIASLVNFQFNHAKRPWILFLTTRAGKDHVAERNLTEFVAAIEANILASNEFDEQARAWLECAGDDLLAEINLAINDPVRFKDVFCMGFGKWLLRLLASGGEPPDFEVLPAACYSVKFPTDMVALAFRIGVRPPQDLVDRHGLANPQPLPARGKSEEAWALEMLNQLREMVDVDKLLKEDLGTVDELIEDTEKLLARAGVTLPDFRERALFSVTGKED